MVFLTLAAQYESYIDPAIIKKGRGQKAGGRRNTVFCPLPTTKGSKGLRPPPQSLIWWPQVRRGLNPLLTCSFCPLPSAFCLLNLLTVPLALLGALSALALRGLVNDVYANVALVMLIGLASKNAIKYLNLIIF
ncbi:RND multidrug efflux transporter [Tolypothrix sp. NIES-4075]|nr:efflux RND transporter permease subunit [Tolypothrix sp. NIES-4075]GAX39314.1 RND multidrug efflux transporter [Tolypothrix sp. NIES-4075]